MNFQKLINTINSTDPVDFLIRYLRNGSVARTMDKSDPTHAEVVSISSERSGNPEGYELLTFDHISPTGVGFEIKLYYFCRKKYLDSIRLFGKPIYLGKFMEYAVKLPKYSEYESYIYEPTHDEAAIIFQNERVIRATARNKQFIIESITGDYAKGWEGEATANITSIRTSLTHNKKGQSQVHLW